MAERRKDRRARRLSELQVCATRQGLCIQAFGDHHFRVTGKNPVDYWPTAGTAWILESKSKGFKATPAEVCEIAGFEM